MSVQKHYDMGLEDGAYWERERIIQMLGSLDCDVNGKEHDCNPLDNYTIQDLIALIKGEQK